MPFGKIDVTLTAQQVSDIENAIAALKNTLPVSFNLTKDERTALPNINNERLPFVQRAIEDYAPSNNVLVSGFAGTLPEAKRDLKMFAQLDRFISLLKQVVEIYEDTQQVAGSEAYTFTRELYNSAKRAALNRVPGSDAVVDDLGTLFDGQGPHTNTDEQPIDESPTV